MSDNQLRLTLANDQLFFKQNTNTKKNGNIDSWTDAFITFSLIYVKKHHVRASELFKYMSIVRTSNQRPVIQSMSRNSSNTKEWLDTFLIFIHINKLNIILKSKRIAKATFKQCKKTVKTTRSFMSK